MNTETVTIPFPRSEYLDRVSAVKRRMDAAGIDVLLVSDPCNMNYLTGYDATSYYVHQMVAVALENANLIQHQRNLSDELAARVSARTEELAALSAIAAEMVLQQPLPACSITLPSRWSAPIVPRGMATSAPSWRRRS